MKIFSKLLKNIFSKRSCNLISSSCFNKFFVLMVFSIKISLTLKKCGLSSLITQVLGEMDTSQAVKANSASIVTSGDIPGARCTIISTNSAVLSSIFLILIFPLSLAATTLSINPPVVVPKGISVIANVFLSRSSIFARTRIFPPR
ncbi:hypothetical protein D3C86_1717950 [compost metagenome]